MEIAPFLQILNPIPTNTTGQGSVTSSLNFRHLLSQESLNQQPPTVKHMDISATEKVTLVDILKDLTTIVEKLPGDMNASNSIIDDYSYNSFGVSDLHSTNSEYEEMTTTSFLLNNELKDVLAENPTINDLVDKLNTIPSVVNLFSVVKAVEGLNDDQQFQFQPILSGINTFLEQEFSSFKNKDKPSSENMLKSFANMNTNDQAHLEGQVLFGKLIEQSNDRDLVVEKLLNISNVFNARKHDAYQADFQVKKDLESELRLISSSSDTISLIENLFDKLDTQTIQSILDNTANRFLQNNVNKDHQIVKTFEEHVHFMGVGKNSSILKVEPDLEQKHQQIIDQSIHLIETGLSQLSNLDIDLSAIKEVLTKGLNGTIRTEGVDEPNKIVVMEELHPLLNTLLMLHQDLEKTGLNIKEISQQIQHISQDNSKAILIKEIELDVSTLNSLVKGIKSILDGIQLLSLKSKATTSLFSNIEEAIKTEFSNFIQLHEELGDTQPTISKLQLFDSLGENKQPTVNFLREIKEESFVLQLNHMSSTEIDANGFTTKSDASIRQEFTNQLLDAFKNSKFAQMPNGANRLILKLNPEHLGVITVKLIQKNGEMIARLITSSGSAKELLDHSIHQLKQVLPNIQIEIERFDVQTEHSPKTTKDQSENREDRSNEEQQKSLDDENNNEQSFMESLKAVLNTTV
ncbi:flagellar hook-length control protein FliK [Metabacillus halosaccharovorans]|uniref:flagellar hook-length control protein FliK n=1 Tax=Metabacillus halosaccharovorans TaxID=930124 RepID=UPI00403D5E90